MIAMFRLMKGQSTRIDYRSDGICRGTAMKRLTLSLTLGLSLTLAVIVVVSRADLPVPPHTLYSGHHFLPPYLNSRDRFGFDSTKDDPLTNYDVALLNAGWYSDWGASVNPAHPDRLTYVQLIRFTAGSDPHDPAQVTISPNRETIAQIAAANPGSLWLMSNEPDSLYQGNPIYPDVYAHVYHELHHYIKALDPTALIANGGIVQPTPCRMAYLDVVWDTYHQAFGETIPVDAWNIHAFTLREVYGPGEWGASTPPGVDPSCGIDYRMHDADDMDIFRENLIAFRQWMKDKGEQNKPLIISEYGILWPEYYPGTGTPLKDEEGNVFSPTRVSHFMTQTFDLLLNEAFPDVGYPEGGYRLVQAWTWYSLSDTYYNGNLFDPKTGQITPMGQTYADYVAALPDPQYTDAVVQLWLDAGPLEHLNPAIPHDGLTVTLPVAGGIANLGKAPVQVPVSAPLLGYQEILSMPARYEGDVGALLLPSLVLTRSGVYDLLLVADPAQQIVDPRRWNNAFTVTVDARPDLVISTTAWSAQPVGVLSGTLIVTATVTNTGMWPSPSVSGTLTTSKVQSRFPIPAIGSGAQESVVDALTLPASSGGLVYVTLEVDSDSAADEQNESNNWYEMTIDARPDLTISTTAWSVRSPITIPGALSVTLGVLCEGPWPTVPVSTTISLEDARGVPLPPDRRLATPALLPGAQAAVAATVTLALPASDLYRLTAQVDSDDIQDEHDEGNNTTQAIIHVVVTTTLQPDATGVLTSASGHLVFIFPAGTVTAPTEIHFTPLLTSEVPAGIPLKAAAFQLAAYRDGQPVSLTLPLPVTVTWQYADADIAGLRENRLDLYLRTQNDHWQQVSSPAEQRWLDENRLRTAIQQLGEYTFGHKHTCHLPLVMR
jgi:hypothetical protein